VNQLSAVLVARSHGEGKAFRTASMLHRRLLPNPIVLVLWQLGAEPFSAAAIGYGQAPDDLHIVVAGDPRNRDLAFSALLAFGEWFTPRFEGAAADRVTLDRGKWHPDVPRGLPQIVVANRTTVDFLGRLGRRLAYLTDRPERPVPEGLRALGQHLLFLGRHVEEPGQQLIVPLGQVVADHWATAQTEFERASFQALDAFIAPPAGMSPFDAAAEAELHPAGPLPASEEDQTLEPLVEAFNLARAGRTESAVVQPLLVPIASHYRPLVERTWRLIWRALERERAYTEALSVPRRVDEDRLAYARHIDWTAAGGFRRTRQTARQAITTMHRLEEAKARLLTEEALNDPLRMIPYLLDGKAIEGKVVQVDLNYAEIARVRTVRRPLVTIVTDTERPLPMGKELWWTENPSGRPWVIHRSETTTAGLQVTLKLTTSGRNAPLPSLGDQACFSIHNLNWQFPIDLSPVAPWPLRAPDATPAPAPIEADDEGVA